MSRFAVPLHRFLLSACVCALVLASGGAGARSDENEAETEERARIAAANLEDAIVVDCQLPGKLKKLGGMRTYMTPGALVRLSAVDCRARGGEYTLGDLSSGTLSIQRWMPLAQNGDAEAQYYVARIHANGMGGAAVDYAQAAQWYQRAADQDYSPAIAELGFLYEQGLGVEKDAMRALNLQRRAAGLGEELDYAWKIAAAEEDAERRVAALSEQLNAANADLETLRAQLQDTTNAAFRSREALARSETQVLDLREQLASARRGVGDVGVDTLERSLAAREQELNAANERMRALTARMDAQEAELSARMAQSQGASRDLNELLANEQAKSQALEARLAQADQRLLRSQQELAEQRTQYRADVERLVAERADLERASAKSKDEVTALLAARERELARQQMRVSLLEKALAEKMTEQKKAAAAGAGSAQKAQALEANVRSLQAQVAEQQQQLAQRTQEMASLRDRASSDRNAVARELQEKLAQRTTELEAKEQRLAALTAETGALRNEVTRLQAQRTKDASGAVSEAERARASLRMAQQKLSEQRERLEQMQVEKAAEMAALVKARDDLQRQLAANRRASDAQVAFLQKDLDARRKDLEARDGEIARLQGRLEEQTQRFNEMLAQAPSQPSSNSSGAASSGAVFASAPGAPGGAVKMRSADMRASTQPGVNVREAKGLTPGGYHALIIGNSLYHYMESLDTPANDAKAIAELLSSRYGFKTKVLLDATREQIMTSLHQATLDLTPQDSFLIYYAGHGDLAGPSGRAFWLGVEADPDTRTGWLEADHIRAKIKEMRAKHVVLVADSCFSGAITHPKTTTIGRGLNDTRLRVQWNRRARMVLTSGQVTPVADSEGGGAHSVFARHFLQTLRQNDSIMSGEMLSHELRERMLAQPVRVGAGGQRQTPTYSTLQDANHDVGDFFFVPAPTGVRVASLDF